MIHSYRALFFGLILSVLSGSQKGAAQALPPLQPEQDPCNALMLCGTSFTTAAHYTGPGVTSQPVGCLFESNSMWLVVEIATAGNVIFTITPNNQYDDYDFAIVDITNATCNTWTAANVIRCNANNNYTGSSPGGMIGLNTTSLLTNVIGGTFGSPFLQQLTVTAGQKFLIVIDWAGNYANPSSTPSGFTIDFAGSTATFVGGTPPLYDTIKTACDYRYGLEVHMTAPVKCSSLQANGSDFELSPALATVSTATGAGCALPTSTTQNIVLTFSNPLPPGTYYLKAKNGTDTNTLLGVCDAPQPLSDSIQFRVEAPLTVDAGQDTVTCIKDFIQMNAQIGGGPFLSTTIAWSPGTYLNNTTIANPITTPTNDVTYIVTVTPNNLPQCAKSDTVVVSVLQGFTIYNKDTTICKGASVQINATGDPRYTYTWIPATYVSNSSIVDPVITPDTTTSYTIIASKTGCTDSLRNITITVEPVPTVDIGPDLVLCYGDTLHMKPVVTPDWYQGYSFAWDPPAVFDQATVREPVFTATDTTTVRVDVTTAVAGCTASDTRIIYVIPKDFAEVSSDTAICPGESAQLTATGGVQYTWVPGLWLSDTTIADPVSKPLTSIEYTVYATNVYQCLDTQTVKVVVHPEATIHLPDTATIYPGETYTIDPATNCLYFDWFPPLGLSDAHIANPVASPEVNTRYIVNARTESGCAVTDSIDIRVSLGSVIDVPNAFTPGSAPNSLLKPVRKGNVRLRSFLIYDRWGKKVYESSDVEEGWDGRFNDVPQPMGVYVYMIEAELPGGRIVTKQGNITLLR